MVSFMENHPEYFEETLQLAISDKHPYAWRAAWLSYHCMEENDCHVQKYIPQIIDNIKTKKDGHQRELVKILLKMDLNEEQEGRMLDCCMDLWEMINKAPSVRYIAFTYIIRLAKRYPELANEVKFLIEDHYLDTLSPGIKNSIRKMAQQFYKQL